MKPVTPQEYADCYGQVIADINSSNLPNLQTWFSSTFPTVIAIAKLNSNIFGAYTSTLGAFPRPGATRNLGKDGLIWASIEAFKQGTLYNKTIEPYWTALTIELKFAMEKAEVNPVTAAANLANLRKLKPLPQTKVSK